MTRRPVALGLVLVVLTSACGGDSRSSVSPVAASGTPATGEATSERTPYSDRLAMTKALATTYPGTSDPEPTLGRFGLWAGILVQTGWQQSSHRDQLTSWNQLNTSLDVMPSSYAHDFESGTGSLEARCAANAFVLADPAPSSDDLPDRAVACVAWMRFFAAAQQHESVPEVVSLMWKAHSASLISVLRSSPRVLEESSTPEEENFLASWLEIVLVLEALGFPTVASTSVPARQAVMPNCSPIGSEGCSVSQSDLGSAYGFASTLADHPVSAQKIISLYRLGTSNPAALIATAGSDVSIATALQAYLSAAGWSATGLVPFPVPTLPVIGN